MFKFIFRTLKYKNFRLFFLGQTISLTGTWMQNVALGWLIYKLTNSSFWLGAVIFFVQLPSFILSPFAGVFVDRWNKHKIIIVAQILAMCQAFAFAILTLTNHINIWQIIMLGSCLGFVSSLEIPARHSLLVDMIDKKEDLSNAIALNSLMFNLARLIGPAIAGVIIGLYGEGICFLINGVSYIAVILALVLMKISKKTTEKSKNHPLKDLREGIRYAYGFTPIRSILLLVGILSLMGSSQSVLMPVFARDVLKGDAFIYGIMVGVLGFGALIGALFLAARRKQGRIGKIIPVTSGVFGALMIVFAFSKVLWISLIILFFTGFCLMVHMVSANTALQTMVDDDKRGRVMSFYTMAFMGMATFGSFWGGFLASKVGASLTLIVGGIFCMIGSLVFMYYVPSLKKQAVLYNKLDVNIETNL